jgi:hypothetical protein
MSRDTKIGLNGTSNHSNIFCASLDAAICDAISGSA